MSTANDNAFPIPGLQDDASFNGLTKREYIATKLAAGMLSDESRDGGSFSAEGLARRAYSFANALLAELEKKQ